MSYASLDELMVRVPGGVPASEELRAQAYLDDASDLIDEETQRVFSDVPAVVRRICLAAALRAWANPGFIGSTNIGDFGERYTTQGGVYLTAEERERLRRLRVDSDLWVQPIGRRDPLVHDGDDVTYFADGNGGDPIPVGW